MSLTLENIKSDNLELLKHYLKNGKAGINDEILGYPLLAWALYFDAGKIANFLVDQDANLNVHAIKVLMTHNALETKNLTTALGLIKTLQYIEKPTLALIKEVNDPEINRYLAENKSKLVFY